MKIKRVLMPEFCDKVNNEDWTEEKVFGFDLDDDQDQVIYHYHDENRKLVGVYHDMGPTGKGGDYYLISY